MPQTTTPPRAPVLTHLFPFVKGKIRNFNKVPEKYF
jgi:hypothetical protein